MRAVDLKEHDLQRKKFVASDYRTDERDRAADWFEQEILDKDRWPLNLSQLEEESEWSRQHIKNVLDHYFEVVDEETGAKSEVTGRPVIDGERVELSVTIPGDVEVEAYLRGFIAGYVDGIESS